MPYWDPRTKKWIGVFNLSSLPRRQKSFARKADAKSWEVEQRKLATQPTSTSTAFGVVYSEYLDFAEVQYTRKTYEEKVAIGRRFIEHSGNLHLNQITSKTLHDFLLDSREKVSANRANKDRKNLLAFWNWAQRIMDIRTNPVAKIGKFPHRREAQYIPPESHILQILAASTRKERVFLNAYLHTAARRSSIFKWKWGEDIDFQLKQIRIGSAKTKDGSTEYIWLPMSDELFVDLHRLGTPQ
jgi:hypothetical protein